MKSPQMSPVCFINEKLPLSQFRRLLDFSKISMGLTKNIGEQHNFDTRESFCFEYVPYDRPICKNDTVFKTSFTLPGREGNLIAV